jgi:hypothetical protein
MDRWCIDIKRGRILIEDATVHGDGGCPRLRQSASSRVASVEHLDSNRTNSSPKIDAIQCCWTVM